VNVPVEPITVRCGEDIVLEVNQLAHRFGDHTVLAGVTFQVEPGQMVGFVGGNGAGKTTTMRAMLGLLRPDGGSVRWCGEEPTLAVRRRLFGYMPEERGLYPKMRVDEQLRFLGRLSGLGSRAAKRATDHWLSRLELSDRADSLLDDLSLGNQQRVQLAAAVLHGPKLLVLDEPFSGLDPVGVDLLTEALVDEVRRGAGTVFSSHQLDLVERICDRVVIIDGGRVVADGPISELRAAYARRQLRVVVHGAPADWADGVRGVQSVVVEPDGALLLRLGPAASIDAVVDAARAAGSVRHVSEVMPTLAELYRQVIAA
jgi:ABC-2 type transport system ATP-binding protein